MMNFTERLQERYPHIKPLLVVEAGSRAWGFQSPDSDYDIRFVYSYKDPYEYIALSYPPDVLEFKETYEDIIGNKEDLFEYAGWDIRKALFLAAKSNFALYEWLRSPIKYSEGDSKFLYHLNLYVENNYSYRDASCHYRGMAKQVFKDMTAKSGEKTLKRFLYAIRPLLCIQHIHLYKKFPPVLFKDLVRDSHIEDPEFYKMLDELLRIKMETPEKYEVPEQIEVLFYAWIKSQLSLYTSDFIKENIPHRDANFALLNKLYKTHLNLQGNHENKN